MIQTPDRDPLARLHDELIALRASILARESEQQQDLDRIPVEHRASGRNLVHYLALRSRDLRELQVALANHGLSSLGRAESHVLAAVDVVIRLLHQLTDSEPLPPVELPVRIDEGSQRLEANAVRLLGPAPAGRRVRVMVTLPSSAADDPDLVRTMVEAGMDLARINAAHDDAAAWERMAHGVRRASAATGRSCLVYFDLAGPKLRTGAIGGGPRILRLKPVRDAVGRTVRSAAVVLHDPATLDVFGEVPKVPIEGSLVTLAAPGDRVEVVDARDRRRRLTVVERLGPAAVVASADRTVCFETGARVRLKRDGRRVAKGTIGALPEVEAGIHLDRGDRLFVTSSGEPGVDAVRDRSGRVLEPARVPCTLPEAVRSAKIGQPIWFDDGKFGGRIVEATDGGVVVEITQVPVGGGKLRSDKGINLPETDLQVDRLTAKDLADLDVAARIADVIGLSFVEGPEEVLRLHEELDRRGASAAGIVLKIETPRAFRQLPQLLLVGLRSPPLGVMVARGDLAVEVGFARMAEVQEEILWLCEAAHVPVIWATQVLEGLAKTGIPSRAEVSDAAMGVRAECVMLNKGPHIVAAVRFLDDVLARMEQHHSKKRSMLRRLRVSEP